MRKRPYREGDWFAVPLGNTGFAVGLVARIAKSGVLGYFFGPCRAEVPRLGDLQGYRPQDAILVAQFGDLELCNGDWVVLGRLDTWERDRWPIPIFGRYIDAVPEYHPALAWRVEYPDGNLDNPPHETRITVEDCAFLPKNSLFGAQALQIALTKLLGTEQDVALLKSTSSRSIQSRPPMTDHYLYFPGRTVALKASRTLKRDGYNTTIRKVEGTWLVLAQRPLPTAEGELQAALEYMEELATAAGGTYDGHMQDVVHST